MKAAPQEQFAALVGIDWADRRHAVCLQVWGAATLECSTRAQKPEVIDAWATALRQRVAGRPVALCLELRKGPLVYALAKDDFLVLFPVHPQTVARYRRAFTPARAYAGIAPVTERSGQTSWVHWRYSCPQFLRQSLVEWAGESSRPSFWAKAFYRSQRAKGKSPQMAVRALAFKWIRIVFHCWQTRKPYDEAKYLLALQAKGSPWLTAFVSPS
jgi:hypothetical protein